MNFWQAPAPRNERGGGCLENHSEATTVAADNDFLLSLVCAGVTAHLIEPGGKHRGTPHIVPVAHPSGAPQATGRQQPMRARYRVRPTYAATAVHRKLHPATAFGRPQG